MRTVRSGGATNASLVTLIMPLTPILFGASFWASGSPRATSPAPIIAAALIIIDGRAFHALDRTVRG